MRQHLLRHCADARIRTELPSSRSDAYQGQELRLVKADERYWFNTYSSIFESRVNEESELLASEEDTDVLGASGLSPFILYPFQDYWLTWHGRQLRSLGALGDSITLKSRAMGASNLAAGSMVWRWMTRTNYPGRL